MDWRRLAMKCEKEGCEGQLDLKNMESVPCNFQYLGRRYWTHGYRCPSCKQAIWLQQDVWFRSDYERSPIQTWDFFGHLLVVSLLLVPLGLLVRLLSDFGGFVTFLLGAMGAFIGGGVVLWKDIRRVADGEETANDRRLVFPFFATAVLIPACYFAFDSETVLMWGYLSAVVGGYLVGSLLEKERR